MKKHLRLLFSLAVPALVLILAACGATQSGTGNTYTGSSYAASPTATTSSSAATPTTAATGAATIKTASVMVNGTATTVLTDARGWTLYYFVPDNTTTTSQCTGACATAWPPVTSSTVPTNAALSGQFALQQNANGSQVTYNGHPLYTYAADGGPGMATGEGANGGKWHVATPDLKPTTLGS